MTNIVLNFREIKKKKKKMISIKSHYVYYLFSILYYALHINHKIKFKTKMTQNFQMAIISKIGSIDICALILGIFEYNLVRFMCRTIEHFFRGKTKKKKTHKTKKKKFENVKMYVFFFFFCIRALFSVVEKKKKIVD